MTTAKPVPLLFGRRYVTPVTLEDELSRAKLWHRVRNGSTELRQDVTTRGVRIDLCAVEWLDLGASAQLVALAEAISRSGAQIEIVTPFPNRRRADLDTPDLDDRLARRFRASRILEHLEFVEAVRTAAARYNAAASVRVRPNVDTSTLHNAESPGGEEIPAETGDAPGEFEPVGSEAAASRRRKAWVRMSPLRWLRFEDQHEVEEFAQEISELLLSRAGFHPLNVGALTNAIFQELLENVTVHAGSAQHAVVSAWIRPTSRTMVPSAYLTHERSYVEWLFTQDSPVLELVIADSGDGAAHSLRKAFERRTHDDANVMSAPAGDARILAWAWDRWSTRFDNEAPRRGMRGLYRVDRVARRHHGLATMRAGTRSVGWDHGGAGHDRLVWSPQGLAITPGTVVHLLLPTLPVEHAPVRVEGGKPFTDVTVRWVHLGPAPVNGLSVEQTERIASASRTAEVGKPVCLVAQCDPPQEQGDLVAAIEALSEHAHPATLVVFGLSDDETALRSAVEVSRQNADAPSANDDPQGTDTTEVASPVLVMLPDGDAMWGGVPTWLATVLDRLIHVTDTSLSRAEIQELLEDPRHLHEVYWRIRDTAIATADASLGLWPRVSIANLVAEVRARIAGTVAKAVDRNEGRVIRTPTLRRSRAWITPPELWAGMAGDHPGLYALAAITRNHIDLAQLQRTTLVLDSITQVASGMKLRRYLRCRDAVRLPHYAELAIPPGTPLLPEPGPAIVYCDVILSGESVQRTIKQILRDGGRPLAVLCAVDGRIDPNEPVRVLGTQYPVYSLTDETPLLVETGAEHPGPGEEATVTVSGSGMEAHPLPLPGPAAETPFPADDLQILDQLIEGKGLHFTHVVRPNGRHFTLWVDPLKLTSLQNVRYGIKRLVDEWQPDAEEPFAVWYPVTRETNNEPLQQLGDWLRTEYGARCRIVPIVRTAAYGRWIFPTADEIGPTPPNVLLLDTSSVDGGTINSLLQLAAECAASSILACLVLCQLPIEHRSLYESLLSLKAQTLSEVAHEQREFPLAPSERVERVTTVRVRFLGQLPSSAYTYQTCPVCAQKRAISALHPTNEQMEELRGDTTEEYLRPREAREVERSEPRALFGAKVSGAELREILTWRRWLLAALTGTRDRWHVLDEVTRLASADTAEAGASRRALLHLIVVESQWLALPPLEFTILRERLGALAQMVIVDPTEESVSRLHAMIVLRLARTHDFAATIGRTLEAVAGDERLEEHALFLLYTFVERPFHASPNIFASLVDTLRKVVEAVEQKQLTLSSDSGPSLLSYLWYRVRLRRLESRAQALTKPLAAELLRKSLLDVPAEVRSAFEAMDPSRRSGNLKVAVGDQMRSGMSRALTPGAERWLRQLPRHVDTLRRWTHESLVVYARALEPLLQRAADSPVPAIDREFMMLLIESNTYDPPDGHPLFRTAAFLSNTGDIPYYGEFSAYEAAYRWWRDNIFSDRGQHPSLHRWLASIPANVSEAISRIRERLEDEERLAVIDPTGVASTLPHLFAPQEFLNHAMEEFVWELVREIPNDGRTIEIRLAQVPHDGRHVRFSLLITTDEDRSASAMEEHIESSRSAAFDRLSSLLSCADAKVTATRTRERSEWLYQFSFQEPWAVTDVPKQGGRAR